MASDFDLTLDPDTVSDYAAAADRTLTCPTKEENPTCAGNGSGFGTWTEKVKIRDTDILPTKKDPGNGNRFSFLLVLEVQGPEGGGYKPNGGKTHYEYLFVDKTELLSGESQKAAPHKRRVNVVNSLLAALGVDVSKGVASYKDWLQGAKPLVGQEVACVFRKYKRRDTGEPQLSIDGGFLPLA